MVTQAQRDWQGLQAMLLARKTKAGFSARATAMFHASRSPTTHKIDLLKKQMQLSLLEERALREMRRKFRSAVSAGGGIWSRRARAWSARISPISRGSVSIVKTSNPRLNALQAQERLRARIAEQARRNAIHNVINESNRKNLSVSERNRLLSERLAEWQKREDSARNLFDIRVGKLGGRDALGKRIGVTKDLFIEQRVVRTTRIKGQDVPVTKTYVVDSRGRIVRLATSKEERKVRESQRRVELPPARTGTTPIISRRIEELTQKEQSGKITAKESIELAGLIAGGTLIGGAVALLDLPKAPKQLVDLSKKLIANPELLLEVPSAIKRGAEGFGLILKTSPTTAFAKIGANIVLLHVSGKVLKVLGKVSSNAFTRFSPRFRGVRKRSLSIPSRQRGKTLTIQIRSRLGRGARPAQVALAGKEVTAVSAQADKLIRFMRTKRIIRKPIRGEKGLTKLTKKLLKKFDDGTITKKQLISLDRRIRTEAKKGILERSFFADPSGVARKRFLKVGKQKEASLLDILSGDVSFKTSSPQLLVFEKVKVQAFPKTKIFKSITNKLKAGKTLTQKESGALLKFQLKKTGKFKPVGFQTTELEVTLAPGEIVKKVKTVAVTLINGKRVPIVQAKVVKATSATKKLLSKAKKGKLTAKELKTLRKNLKKETGFSSSISRSAISKPRLPLGRKSLSIAIRPRRRPARRKPVRRRVPLKRVVRRRPVRRKPVARKVVRRPVRRKPIVRKVVRKPVKRKPIISKVVRKGVVTPFPRRKKKVMIRKKKPQPIPTFNVLGKSGKKFVRINKIPLSRNDALSRGTFAIDHSTSRTFKIIPAGRRKKIGSITKREKNYFNRAGFKLREFKVKGGRKFQIKPKYIERTKYGIDTPGEKRGLTLARLAKQRGFVGKRKPSRVRTRVRASPRRIAVQRRTTTRRKPSQAQLQALANGRAKLKRIRKKR